MADPSRTVDAAGPVATSDRRLLTRLSLMMFLQYFVQGCYLPIISVYLQEALGFSQRQVGVFGSALAVGPLVAPFVIGQLVDRRFATERVLAVCHLCGGVVMLWLYWERRYGIVVLLGTLYSVLYVPSLMLTNSLAFHHLVDREREFPWVRMFGTIGFVVPAWLIEALFLRNFRGEGLNDARGVTLAAAGLAGLAMAAYSLTLPSTPPHPEGRGRFAPGVALRLVGRRPFLVLVLVSFLIAIVHKFYFVLNSPFLKAMVSQHVQGAWEARISSLGQIAEIGVMAGLGMIIARIGFKGTMLVGVAAYAVRCGVFAMAATLEAPFPVTLTIICAGQLLHGLCFGCFLAAAFIYLDRTTPADLRGSVQNLYGTFVLGFGFFVGGFFSGWVAESFRTVTLAGPVDDWAGIWLSAGLLACLCLAILAAGFPRRVPEPEAR